ncbi:pyrroline-5-carboxylate reductase [Phellopilus nigrolimitatus]|nr:pyrroline-5-carboxylate reductase [Phellopilus nigrolimitatus]
MGYTLCVLGCGTMGVAVLSGIVASLESLPHHSGNGGPSFSPTVLQTVPKWEHHTSGTSTPVGAPDASLPSRFIACVNREESARKLERIFHGNGGLSELVEVVAGENLASVNTADVVLLCCKPQLAYLILSEPGINDALEGKLLVSILAGVTISQLKGWVQPSTRVVRAMPNTPCKIREGMTVVTTLPSAPETERDRQIILRIFSSIGRCRFLDEKHFDACTAVSASGPAFACVFLEAIADGGVMMGLPRAEALELAAQTLQGAARMALQSGAHPAQIKDAVTTPGGCTIAGLLALEDGKVRSTIARAIQVATERASELGQMPSKK